jgi:hypothetical protein
MVALDELVEERVKLAIASLHQAQKQGVILPDAPRHGSLGVAFVSYSDLPRGVLYLAQGGERNQPVGLQFLQERATFFVLEFSVRSLPFEELADGFGKLRQAECGKIFRDLMDQLEVRGRKPASRGVDLLHLPSHAFLLPSMTVHRSGKNVQQKMQLFTAVPNAALVKGFSLERAPAAEAGDAVS